MKVPLLLTAIILATWMTLIAYVKMRFTLISKFMVKVTLFDGIYLSVNRVTEWVARIFRSSRRRQAGGWLPRRRSCAQFYFPVDCFKGFLRGGVPTYAYCILRRLSAAHVAQLRHIITNERL